MRAVQIERFGRPEVLVVSEVSSPEPQGKEVLLEVEAASVNPADLLSRAGLYHRAGHPLLVPGFEGSGVVREVGDSVERFAPGGRVFAFGGSSTKLGFVNNPGKGAGLRRRVGRRVDRTLVVATNDYATRRYKRACGRRPAHHEPV